MAHPTGPYLGKDLVGLEDLSAEQITAILDTSEPFEEISERAIKKTPVLRGKTIVNAFFENSTRTRIYPTQGLLDMLTLRDHFGRIAGLRVCASWAACSTRAWPAATSGASGSWAPRWPRAGRSPRSRARSGRWA